MIAVVPNDLAEIISAAGVAAMNRCQKMAGRSGTAAIHERYLSSMMAAELWERLNVPGVIECDVVAEATYTEFYLKNHPDASKDDVNRLHGGERIDVLLSFPKIPADVLIEVKLYDDGKKWTAIAKDRDKLRRVASNSPNLKCYVAIYVTEIKSRYDTSLLDRIKNLSRDTGCEVIAGETQQVSDGWKWCFATLAVPPVQQAGSSVP